METRIKKKNPKQKNNLQRNVYRNTVTLQRNSHANVLCLALKKTKPTNKQTKKKTLKKAK